MVARGIAERELDGTESPEQIEKVSLLLSEITAERVGRSLYSHPRLTIDVRKSPRQDRWAVIDRGLPSLPAGLRSTALDKIADAWGVSRKSGLTRTWFELDRRDCDV